DHRLLRVDLNNNSLAQQYAGHTDWVLSAAVRREESQVLLLGSAFDGQMRIWDNASGDVLQHWLANASEGASMRAMSFIKYTPPVEIRMTEQPNFLGGLPADGTRSQWMRLPRAFPDNPLLNSLLMTYASDYFLLDMISRADQSRDPNDTFNGTSLDHSLWFHCPVKFDQWHLYTQHVQALAGQRGLVRGTIHDIDGKLVASVMQEGLMRPPRKAGS
ncbi:MAG TPA: thioesterase family protein, partial [Ilumatobacteraceae bacterium]|nr:thioesterase family protein [Ilumatobacteraceae bacterium]